MHYYKIVPGSDDNLAAIAFAKYFVRSTAVYASKRANLFDAAPTIRRAFLRSNIFDIPLNNCLGDLTKALPFMKIHGSQGIEDLPVLRRIRQTHAVARLRVRLEFFGLGWE